MTGRVGKRGGSAAGAGKGVEFRIACRSCSHRYPAQRHEGVCPICGFDPLVNLMHAMDPLAWTVRLSRTVVVDRTPGRNGEGVRRRDSCGPEAPVAAKAEA